MEIQHQSVFPERTPVLSVDHLSKRLSGRPILHDVSFTVEKGEIFGFLGPNGSGKTTTIKLILGLLRPDAGRISIAGYDIATDFEKALAEVGGIVENPELYSYLTGYENLEHFRRMYTGIPKSRTDEVVAMVGLSARIHDKVSKYSLGMRQRLGVAQALLNHPKLLIFDEPTNGLDPEGIRGLRDLLKNLASKTGVSVLISSHQLFELEQLCDRVAVIDRGMIVGIRSMEEMHGAKETASGETTYFLTLSDPKTALGILASGGFAVEEVPNGLLITVDKTRLNEVFALLLPSGIQIFGASEEKRTLEESFLEMTRGASPESGIGIEVGTNLRAAEAEPPAVAHTPLQGEIYVPPAAQKEQGSTEQISASPTKNEEEDDNHA